MRQPPPFVPPRPLGAYASAPSAWQKYLLIAIGGFATAAGGAAWSQSSAWFGGIATRGYVDTAIAAELAPVRQVTTNVDARIDEILREVRLGNTRQLERVGLVVRERVGLQAALHVGLDPKRREASQKAAATARAKFDELVLRGSSPEDAASKVLEYAGVPR